MVEQGDRTTSDIEPQIKQQYAKFFRHADAEIFRQLAEHYFSAAASLKKKELKAPDAFKLWLRNVQKRLFIGVGCELLLKSGYLQQGYGINCPRGRKKWSVYRLQDVREADYDLGRTYSMNFLLDEMKNYLGFAQHAIIDRGLRIAKVFRNKEGHVAVYWHRYEAQNYSDIEAAIIVFYKEAFRNQVRVRFSMEKGEQGFFETA